MLEVRNLYAGSHGAAALHDVSLDVAEGQFVGLLGANNAGKSTLIHTLSGLVRPMSGTIHFDGEDVTGCTPRQLVERGIVQVPEGRLVFPRMSVRDNLMMGGLCDRARPKRAQRMDLVLETFPRLRERLPQFAGTMSGGEQQMLALGRGMMADGRLLLLDEPSLGLSPLFVQYIFEVLRKLHAEGLTILLVEQNASLTFRNASHCYVLERGRMSVSGPTEIVRQDPATRKAYMGL
jgi:branched-chain amino acid transport system ATP-binding protein